jgi:hypothetical protein
MSLFLQVIGITGMEKNHLNDKECFYDPKVTAFPHRILHQLYLKIKN